MVRPRGALYLLPAQLNWALGCTSDQAMRAVTWNCRRATAEHELWTELRLLQADLLLLQEVGALPPEILNDYEVLQGVPRTRSGGDQRFRTVLAVRGRLGPEIELRTGTAWIDELLDQFQGNLMGRRVTLADGETLNALAVYSPAWPLARETYAGVDVSEVKLPENPDIWVSDLVVAALRQRPGLKTESWLVAGDFNACETFDSWRGGPRGNRRWLDRMATLGLVDCLRLQQGVLTPTFRKPGAAEAHCQIDYVFTSPVLWRRLSHCATGNRESVFGRGLSDHLPVVAEFRPEGAD